ncbi:hypothetical protein HK104_003419 [Borealophlyctis nickersoniae]|nr:hypothetical protein HK104_003419 [Borealophlyctis nickersoniae]
MTEPIPADTSTTASMDPVDEETGEAFKTPAEELQSPVTPQETPSGSRPQVPPGYSVSVQTAPTIDTNSPASESRNDWDGVGPSAETTGRDSAHHLIEEDVRGRSPGRPSSPAFRNTSHSLEREPPTPQFDPNHPSRRPSLAGATSIRMPTLPRGQCPGWSDIRPSHYFKLNYAGAQVALTILIACLFTLIKPVQTAWPDNPLFVALAVVICSEPNQTASIRLFAQRLFGVVIAGGLSILILFIDTILPPVSCLSCNWKPYAVAAIIFIFFYTTVTIRETVPAQAYTSKLTDLTFLLTFLVAYDDQRRGEQATYLRPLTRLASIVLGIALTMLGAFLFWPVRVNLVHRIITANLFKEFAGFVYDVMHEGFLGPTETEGSGENGGKSGAENNKPSLAFHGLQGNFNRTDVTIAVEGGMEVLGSQEAVMANAYSAKGKRASRWGNQQRGAEAEELRAAEMEDSDEELDEETVEKRFRTKLHPAAVKILRTLEKERARLEASYQIEFRAADRPHFVPVAPLDQVIRRLRLFFYQIVALYAERLVELRGYRLQNLQGDEAPSNPFWYMAWVEDTKAFCASLSSQNLAFCGPSSSNLPSHESGSFDMVRYVSSVCLAFSDLGDVVLLTTSRARPVPIGAAELEARLEVILRDLIKARDGLEVELLRVREQLTEWKIGGNPQETRSHLSAPGAGLMVPRIASGPVVALRYAFLLRVWEMTETLVSTIYAVERMVRAYNMVT